jgi:purine nucleosidase
VLPPRRRIVCADAKNEADDQFAIVHALLTGTLDVRGIVPSHFGRPGSMTASHEEVRLLLELLRTDVVVADDSRHALPDAETPAPSPGSRLIVAEALADPKRLFIAVLGPLTDVASAIIEEPSLRERDVVVVWVGGPPYEGVATYAPEFNSSTTSRWPTWCCNRASRCGRSRCLCTRWSASGMPSSRSGCAGSVPSRTTSSTS